MSKFNKLLFFLILFLVPIGTKKFIYSFSLPFNIQISYGSVFIYALDILLALAVVLNLEKIHLGKQSTILFLFLVVSLVSSFLSFSPGLAFYVFAHLVLFGLFSLVFASLLREGRLKLKNVFAVIGASAVFQAIVGLLQFRNQGSIGLKLLGESVLGPATSGIARVFTDFGTFLRVYGTMPHANILAAFLVFGFAGLAYLFLREDFMSGSKVTKFAVIAGMFLIFSALILTFSRSGFIVFAFFAVATAVYGISAGFLRKRTLSLVGILVLFILFVILGFGRLSTARDSFSPDEPSVTYRIDYGLIALNLVKANPVFGVGPGNQIIAGLNAGLYQGEGLKQDWEWQPVHNLYLMVAAETGVIGLVLFVIFLWNVFWPIAREFWSERKNEAGLDLFFPLVIGLSWLLFGLVDHFFWDLESGELMFWLTLGIIMGVSAHSSTDRAYPSEG